MAVGEQSCHLFAVSIDINEDEEKVYEIKLNEMPIAIVCYGKTFDLRLKRWFAVVLFKFCVWKGFCSFSMGTANQSFSMLTVKNKNTSIF